jgi:hypothetical protein
MEDRNEILQAAKDAGFGNADDQLGRLHRARAIAEPTLVRRGRKGTASLYPPGTKDLVLKLLEHRHRRRISERSWLSWWDEGGPLPIAARELLEENAASFDRIAKFLGRLLDREERCSPAAERRMDALYGQAQNSRIKGPAAAARRRVGRSAFSTVARVLTQVGSGRFTAYPEGDTEDDGTPRPGTTAELIEKALGLDRARRDTLANTPPWYSGSSEADLARLSSLLLKRPLAELAQEPDDVLEQGRRDLQLFIHVVTTTAKIAEPYVGRYAFGFGLIGRFLSWQRPGNQTVMLLGWVNLSKEPDLREGMNELVALEPKVRAWNELQGVLDALRKEIPAFAAILDNRRIGRALRSQVETERLNADLATARIEHAAEVKAFLSRHSEIDALLAIVEDE